MALFGLIGTWVHNGNLQKTFAETESFEVKDTYFDRSEEVFATVAPDDLPAEACGAPIVATEGGLVTESLDEGWNEGKGSFVTVEGPKIVSYTHLGEVTVEEGDMIRKGDLIGTAGRSGLPSGHPCVRETE